jgi:tRNA threonylcarbamoyl adenosine modification protein YeaZ
VILGIDTATPATTVALVAEGVVLAEVTYVDPRRHAESLTPAIQHVLDVSGKTLSAVRHLAVGVGPGAFTGLRVGLMTARSLSQALAIPVIGVCTLDVMAYGSGIQEPFAVVTDARRKELFWARYESAERRVAGPDVGQPPAVVEAVGVLPVVGARRAPLPEFFNDPRSPDLPNAGALARLAEKRLAVGGELLPASPVYLREPDVSPAVAPKSVLS